MRDADKDAEEDQLHAQQSEIEEMRAGEGGDEELEQDAPQEMNRFFRIAEAMRLAAADKHDAVLPELGDDFSKEEREAIELIFEAFTANDNGEWLDAEERDHLLNQGLAVLQPVLALGLIPELNAEEIYQDLSERVGALREQLDKLADAQEEIQRTEEELAVESDEDDDDDDDDDGDDGKKAPAGGELDEAARLAAKRRATIEHLGLVDPEPLPPTDGAAPGRGGGKS
jgi:hypothetical protein